MMEEERKTILCMFSGGVTSTAMLAHLLSDPDYEDFDVVAHHLNLITVENRARAEVFACRKMIEYFEHDENYRPFYISESTHDYSFMRPPRYEKLVNELDIVSFMAAQIAIGNPSITHVAIGTTKTDFESNPNYEYLHKRSQQILMDSLAMEESAKGLSIDYPLKNYDLKTVWKIIPKAIRKSTMSCRLPTYTEDKLTALPCGKCIKCVNRKEAKIFK